MTFKTQREILEEAAATGDPDALVRLGDYYADEALISAPEGAQYAIALRYYEAARERGSVAATYRIGELFELGRGVPKDEAKAKALFRETAEAGYGRGLFEMAYMYMEAGELELAEEYFEKTCEVDADVLCDFAEYYLYPNDDTDHFPFSPDKAEALLFRWLKRDGSRCASSFYGIGERFEKGKDEIPVDEARAARLYRAIAELDVVENDTRPWDEACLWRAPLRLGEMYEEGRGVPADRREAERMYRRAIARGAGSEAKVRILPLLLADTNASPEKRIETFEWLWDVWQADKWQDSKLLKEHLRPLAEAGDAVAQYRLSRVLAREEGSARDLRWGRISGTEGREQARRYASGEAVKWARAAAEQGNVEAQRELWFELRTYLPDEALSWLRRAADSGNANALECLADYYRFGDKKAGIRRDRREAIRLYEKASAAEDCEHPCYADIGWCYIGLRDWKGAAEAWTRHLEWQLAKEDLFDLFAAYKLSKDFYAKGRGVPKDLQMATRLMEMAAESHMWEARIAFGDALWRGRGVPANPERAVALFLSEAQLEPFPRWRLAQAYALGRGVPARDFKEAFRWLRGCLWLILCRFRDRLRSYRARWKDYIKGRDE